MKRVIVIVGIAVLLLSGCIPTVMAESTSEVVDEKPARRDRHPWMWDQTNEIARHELISMETGSKTHGTFFLATGSVNEEEHFFCWIKRVDGAMQRVSVPITQALVFETEGPPYVVVTEGWTGSGGKGYWRNGWFFYIPTGSIVPSFDMMRGEE